MRDTIFLSVKVHSYFNNLDINEKKEEFINIVSRYYMTDDVKRKDNFIKRIRNSSERELLNLIDMFFGTDRYYYLWYYEKELELEHMEGFIYQEHEKSCDDLYKRIDDLTVFLNNNGELLENRNRLQDSLNSFMSGILDYDIVEFEKKNSKRRLFGIEKDNKKLLLVLFGELSYVDGVLSYLRTLTETDSIINITKCFDRYFKIRYGDNVSYVSLSEFLNNFIKDVVQFYKARILENDIKISDNQERISGFLIGVKQNALEVRKRAKVQKDINLTINASKEYSIAGMSEDEAEKLFLDIREYIIMSIDDTLVDDKLDVLLKKKNAGK